mmetsp:Transcript_5162/g.10919  ORF Transcript_5162/g.10919 Transcript_5162/m.10919 type:complete len:448 (-) Transcript_5162:174-1517(-)
MDKVQSLNTPMNVIGQMGDLFFQYNRATRHNSETGAFANQLVVFRRTGNGSDLLGGVAEQETKSFQTGGVTVNFKVCQFHTESLDAAIPDSVTVSVGTGTLSCPTAGPTRSPTLAPSTAQPTKSPTNFPTTRSPTLAPTTGPTNSPTQAPTTSRPTSSQPTGSPVEGPTTEAPTKSPSEHPTKSPTQEPTTSNPTVFPSVQPTWSPSESPTTRGPTKFPTEQPSQSPTNVVVGENDSVLPTSSPTRVPTAMIPSVRTDFPTFLPTISAEPSVEPSDFPTKSPTADFPTFLPTILVEASAPSVEPSEILVESDGAINQFSTEAEEESAPGQNMPLVSSVLCIGFIAPFILVGLVRFFSDSSTPEKKSVEKTVCKYGEAELGLIPTEDASSTGSDTAEESWCYSSLGSSFYGLRPYKGALACDFIPEEEASHSSRLESLGGHSECVEET